MTYEQKIEAVALAAWERWTNNGLNMDEDMREQTHKSAYDAARYAYAEQSDKEWIADTLAWLGHKEG